MAPSGPALNGNGDRVGDRKLEYSLDGDVIEPTPPVDLTSGLSTLSVRRQWGLAASPGSGRILDGRKQRSRPA